MSASSATRRADRSHGKSRESAGSNRRTGEHLSLVQGESNRRSSHFAVILATVSVLSLLGMVMVLSASANLALSATGSSLYSFKRHVMWLGAGLVAMFVFMRIDYRRLRILSLPAYLLAVAALVAVLIPGVGVSRNGATRWLGVGSFTVQPGELAKLAMVLFVADFLSKPHRPADSTQMTLRPVLLATGFIAILMLAQPNLGTTIIVTMISIAMLFAAGVSLRSLTRTALIASAIAGLMAVFAPYRRQRLVGFLDPWKNRTDEGAQTIQSMTSIVSGRITGVGLGASRAKFGFLPFPHTDFIFAIIAEELGLIGAVTVVGLFVVLGFVGFAVALHAPDRYGMLLATGITVWLVFQAFVNIAVAVGLLPVTGIPLPFLSFGGSALVVTLAGCGILLSIARNAHS